MLLGSGLDNQDSTLNNFRKFCGGVQVWVVVLKSRELVFVMLVQFLMFEFTFSLQSEKVG